MPRTRLRASATIVAALVAAAWMMSRFNPSGRMVPDVNLRELPGETATKAAKPTPAGRPSWSGECVGVTDGDTLKVLRAGRTEVKIRLYGVDAPESMQAWGSRSKQGPP